MMNHRAGGTGNESERPLVMTTAEWNAKYPLAFVRPGDFSSIIDCATAEGVSGVRGETLAEIQVRYPNAALVRFEDWYAESQQHHRQPGYWMTTTEARYFDMLNVLPPAAMTAGAFLVGEASDHHGAAGRPRFACYRTNGTAFDTYSRPMSHAEFCAIFGQTPLFYS